MIAKKKFQDILDSINDIVNRIKSREEIQSLIDEAKKLENSGHYTDSKVLLGTIAALEGDDAMVDKQFNAAIMNSGGDPFVISNYAVALSNTFRFVKASEYIEKTIQASPDNISFLEQAARLYFKAFNTEAGRSVIERLRKLNHKWNNEQDLIGKFSVLDSVYNYSGSNWKDVASRVEQAAKFINGLGHYIRNVTQYSNGEIIYYQFNFELSNEIVAEIENNLLDYLVSLEYSEADLALAFACKSYEH